MPRVLLLATTTGYQTRAFEDAATLLGIDLLYATDRCHVLDDPWRDAAIPIRFSDERGSAAAIVAAVRQRPIAGVLAVGDRPTAVAALVNQALGLPGHPPEAADAARNKRLTREALRSAGLPAPRFATVPLDAGSHEPLSFQAFPCVVKPLALSGSRGVIRANTEIELKAALRRVHAILRSPDARGE